MSNDSRPKLPHAGSEAELLQRFLAYCQQTLLLKIEGLSDADLRRSTVPSGLTLLGIVKHLAYVHRWWFRAVFAGEAVEFPWTKADPDADFRVEPHESTAAIIALYRDEIAQAQAIVAGADLDAQARNPQSDHSLRWIMLHMIEEIARHNGHADILREQIDGTTGV
jgi:uncharacterized damage-inducible protein DinB